MLIQLTIRNYALIRQLEMTPSQRLSVVTGETGAGKSIMLGAVGLLLGNRADTKVLWDDKEKCIIEGTFDVSSYALENIFLAEDLDYEVHTVIRREISAGGKSRAFINDTPVTLETLRKIGTRLMDIHSQHETLELGNRNFQLGLIDAYAGNAALRKNYQQAWQDYNRLKEEFEGLAKEAENLRQEADFVKFQLDELTKARLTPGEQEVLESELKIAEHAEDIKMRFNSALERLGQSEFSVSAVLADIKNQLQAITAYSPGYQQLYDRLDSLRIELNDILHELEKEESSVEFDPGRTDEVKERLTLIYALTQKHRVRSVAELIELQDNLQQKANKTVNLDDSLAKAKGRLDQAAEKLSEEAQRLTLSREKTFKPLCRDIAKLLAELEIPDAQFKVELEKIAPGPTGSDSIEILFSANKGIAPRPLAQVASGGEFSRLMFCVKYVMAEKEALPTLILDEIDTGVSGETAIKLGKLMRTMAQRHQLIAITHLPQIAAKGDVHFLVFKDNSSAKTESLIRKLSEPERVSEIAKMIGGTRPTATALENAKELIKS